MVAKHSIVHELSANDPKAAGDFYKKLFGWKIDMDEELKYVQFTRRTLREKFNQVGEHQRRRGGVLRVDRGYPSLLGHGKLGGKAVMPKTEMRALAGLALFFDQPATRLGCTQRWPASRSRPNSTGGPTGALRLFGLRRGVRFHVRARPTQEAAPGCAATRIGGRSG
jgi:predicted enzyme related to lactoylglutathione lyase